MYETPKIATTFTFAKILLGNFGKLTILFDSLKSYSSIKPHKLIINWLVPNHTYIQRPTDLFQVDRTLKTNCAAAAMTVSNREQS